MKEFNTTALCRPDRHYMVDISKRVENIKELVDEGKYFTINRARQYGKTTTLRALRMALQEEYIVVALSFEGLTKANFNDEYSYIEDFFKKFIGFRNNLLKVHKVVKADDIYQYYYCYNKRRLEREHEDRSLKELAKKYMSSR